MKKHQSLGPVFTRRNRQRFPLLRGKDAGVTQHIKKRGRPGFSHGLSRDEGVALFPKTKNGQTFRLQSGDLLRSERHRDSSPKRVEDHCTRAGGKLFLSIPLLFSESSGILCLLQFDEDASLRSTVWGGSSAGRALRSQCRGREFDPPPLHHRIPKVSGKFFSRPFFLSPIFPCCSRGTLSSLLYWSVRHDCFFYLISLVINVLF
jgi:hypothetical protein